jgi:Recombination endonuclease VII
VAQSARPRTLPAAWTRKARRVSAALAGVPFTDPEPARPSADPPPPGPPPGWLLRPVKYSQVMNKPQYWRIQVCIKGVCAVAGCGIGGYGALVFDHCHEHGWVRGIVCCAHNYALGQIDAVRRIPGAVVDLAATEYGAILAACPGCAAPLGGDPNARIISAQTGSGVLPSCQHTSPDSQIRTARRPG